MTDRPVAPDDPTQRLQAQAADPAQSVWVTANAGAGKTHVLTERVLRLLLTGVLPESILCLTYTKAAAAEMRGRVSERLAGWALMPEEALYATLARIEGQPPTEAHMGFARALFARALETPGGLKINTIHAFCESVLHRFPLEAGVPFGFRVIEEQEQQVLVRAATDDALLGGLRSAGGLAHSVDVLFGTMSDHSLTEAIRDALGQMRALRPVLADVAGTKARLLSHCGLTQAPDMAEIDAEVLEGSLFPPDAYDEVFAICPPKPGGNRLEDMLALVDRAHPAPEALFAAFLTEKGSLRAIKAALTGAPNRLGARLAAEGERLKALWQRRASAMMIVRSHALLDLVADVVDRYEARKRARAVLDFDDLVTRLAGLFDRPEVRDWVQYKLDGAITHILVDESQDTNPEQWRVVEALVAEFFSGEGAVERPRTVFAVGDQKQSIFSFQGADPLLYPAIGRQLKSRATEARRSFELISLPASFRTLPDILVGIDKVFRAPGLRPALLLDDEPEPHRSARKHAGGAIVMWPPVQRQTVKPVADRWPEPEDQAGMVSADRRIAERIAGTIRLWLDTSRCLPQRGRAVAPDDVMVLVQSRGVLFKEIIRALKMRGIPTPGADRLAVASHIAVLDLLALADVLMNTADDLGLAALLRSPLFDFSEEALFQLAHGRNGRLWDALEHSDQPEAVDACARLGRWRGRLDFERPFEFYSSVLHAEGGLKRFHARLGPEVDDVLSAFLNRALEHETEAQPSLQGFVAAMRASTINIKRELAESGGGVRVMTVHGAKGLEAPIVIIADASVKPSGNQTRRPVHIADRGKGPMFVVPGSRSDCGPDAVPFIEAHQESQAAEYWRKLYVAMTRAEDELYVTGPVAANAADIAKGIKDTWYEAIGAALASQSSPVAVHGEAGVPGLVFPAGAALDGRPDTAPPPAVGLPQPLEMPAGPVPNTGRRTVRPSLDGGTEADPLAPGAGQVRDAAAARREGIVLHALLQHLAAVPAGDRQAMALRALAVLLAEAPSSHARLAGEAMALLDTQALRPLFGPGARAEVPILAHGRQGEEAIRIVGRIDRLVVDGERVLIVDFKSDAAAAAVDRVPAAYMRQLGLYALVVRRLFPKHRVEAAICWTKTGELMPIAPERLVQAVDGFTLD